MYRGEGWTDFPLWIDIGPMSGTEDPHEKGSAKEPKDQDNVEKNFYEEPWSWGNTMIKGEDVGDQKEERHYDTESRKKHR